MHHLLEAIMKFKYIGDPLDITPEGINGGPLYNESYGFKWKKNESVVDVPDKALITDGSGTPAKPPMLICKKLLNNRHFELVPEFKEENKKPRKKPGRPPKKLKENESDINEPSSESIAAA